VANVMVMWCACEKCWLWVGIILEPADLQAVRTFNCGLHFLNIYMYLLRLFLNTGVFCIGIWVLYILRNDSATFAEVELTLT